MQAQPQLPKPPRGFRYALIRERLYGRLERAVLASPKQSNEEADERATADSINECVLRGTAQLFSPDLLQLDLDCSTRRCPDPNDACTEMIAPIPGGKAVLYCDCKPRQQS